MQGSAPAYSEDMVVSVSVDLDGPSLDSLLAQDFVAIELNLKSCDKGFWPIIFIDGIPLLCNLFDVNIVEGGRVVHTFPSSLLHDSVNIEVRLFSPFSFIKSQNMFLNSITFSGYSF